MPRCKHCNVKFDSKYFNQKFCLDKDECINAHSEYAKSQFAKQKNKVWKAQKKELRKELESHSDLIKKCQKVFNEFVRLRDQDKPCISCQKPLIGKYDAGHYYSCGGYPELRFEEDNNHGQCVHCNQHLSGNLIEYTDGLKERIGIYRFNELKGKKHIPKRYTKTELREKIKEYRAKVKALKLDKTSNN